MKRIYKIDGMSCEHCVMAVQKSLSKLNLQKTDIKIGFAEVEFDENKVDDKKIVDAIEEAGYSVKN